MRRYDGLIALVAVATSLLLHALLLFKTGSVAGNSEQPRPERSVTRVSFRSVAAPQSVPETPSPVPEKPPEEVVTEAVEPAPKPEPIEPPEPEQRAKKAVQPKPAEKPVQEERPQPPTPAKPTTVEAQKTPTPSEVVTGTVADPAVVEQAKQEYLRRLMAHIESHKHYPRAARRRGIEGDVSVSFVLHETGSVTAVGVDGAHRVLLSAASEAVTQAQPMPAPPESQPLPWKITFTMRFTLR